MNRSKERTIAEIHADCADEFGAEFRREAEQRADELVAHYEVDRPKTVVQGAVLLRRAYAEVAAKQKAAEFARSVRTDTGPGGLSVTDLEDSDEFKAGTLDEVADDVAHRRKAGTWRPGAFAAEP